MDPIILELNELNLLDNETGLQFLDSLKEIYSKLPSLTKLGIKAENFIHSI